MSIKKFELDAATDLQKEKLPIKTVEGAYPDETGNVKLTKVVHTTGAETVAGTKTFTSSPTIKRVNPYLYIDQTDITKGTPPDITSYSGMICRDVNGKDMGTLYHHYAPDGKNYMRIRVNNPNGDGITYLDVVYTADGKTYATAPTPSEADDNSTKIATTAWVKAKADNYLPLAGGTMTGAIQLSGDSNIFVTRDNDSGALLFFGGKDISSGATLSLSGVERSGFVGSFILNAKGADGSISELMGKYDGTFTWQGKNIERVNAIGSNYIRYENGLQICYVNTNTSVNSSAFNITFPVAFNSYPVVIATCSSSDYIVATYNITTTGFRLSLSDTLPSGNSHRYIAIGTWK